MYFFKSGGTILLQCCTMEKGYFDLFESDDEPAVWYIDSVR